MGIIYLIQGEHFWYNNFNECRGESGACGRCKELYSLFFMSYAYNSFCERVACFEYLPIPKHLLLELILSDHEVKCIELFRQVDQTMCCCDSKLTVAKCWHCSCSHNYNEMYSQKGICVCYLRTSILFSPYTCNFVYFSESIHTRTFEKKSYLKCKHLIVLLRSNENPGASQLGSTNIATLLSFWWLGTATIPQRQK